MNRSKRISKLQKILQTPMTPCMITMHCLMYNCKSEPEYSSIWRVFYINFGKRCAKLMQI